MPLSCLSDSTAPTEGMDGILLLQAIALSNPGRYVSVIGTSLTGSAAIYHPPEAGRGERECSGKLPILPTLLPPHSLSSVLIEALCKGNRTYSTAGISPLPPLGFLHAPMEAALGFVTLNLWKQKVAKPAMILLF